MRTKDEFPNEAGSYPGMRQRDSGVSHTPSSRDQNHDTGQSLARLGKGVTLTHSHWWGRLRKGILPWGLLITVTCLVPAPVPAQPPEARQSPQPLQGDEFSPQSPKQRLKLMQANLDKSKNDAAELAALAKELREELDKPNANALSPESMNRIEKIEKLARKIRDQMRGY